MWRSCLAAALRNLWRNRMHSAINILGLSLGFAAALLIALYVRAELTFDQFFPGHGQIYRLTMDVTESGSSTIRMPTVSARLAGALETEFPGVDMATRLSPALGALRQGDVEVLPEDFFWADPDFFRMFRFRAVAGELATALDRPDGIVLSRSTARRLFGSDEALGRTVQFNRAQTLEVTAVIEDLPWNSHMTLDAVGSGLASFSRLAQLDAGTTGGQSGLATDTYTYVRMREDASPATLDEGAVSGFVARREPGVADARARGTDLRFHLVQLSDIHFLPPSAAQDMKRAPHAAPSR